MKNAAQAYFQTKVSTTDQGQLLLMLYDGALNFLNQARDKMIAKDYAAKGLLISKAIDIVNELSSTLNMEKGGTLAENLNNLYFLCTARLLQANLKMNLDQLDSVVGILSGLRSAYAQIIETPEAQKAAAQIAARMNPDASMSQRAAPIMAPPGLTGGITGQVQARNAYGQQKAHGLAPQAAPVPAPTPAATAPVRTPAAASAPAVAAAYASAPAAQPVAAPVSAPVSVPVAAHPATSVTAFPAPVAPAAIPATPASPAPDGATAAPQAAQGLAPSVGGLGRRMAGYGKFAQGA